MDLLSAMEISSSALSAQRSRLNVISTNLANASTTRTESGGPYRRQVTNFRAAPFVSHLEAAMEGPDYPFNRDPRVGVVVDGVAEDPTPFKRIYDPSHPDADKEGYVEMPNVDIVVEMVNMINASRSYEASVTAVQSSKTMAQKALEIGR